MVHTGVELVDRVPAAWDVIEQPLRRIRLRVERQEEGRLGRQPISGNDVPGKRRFGARQRIENRRAERRKVAVLLRRSRHKIIIGHGGAASRTFVITEEERFIPAVVEMRNHHRTS